MEELHPVLVAQLKSVFGDAAVSAELTPLLHKISEQYAIDDAAKKQLEDKVALRTDQLMSSTSRSYSFLDSLNMGLIMCDVNPEVVLTNSPIQKLLAAKTTASTDLLPPQTGATQWDLATIDNLLTPDLDLKKQVLACLTNNQPIECNDINVGTKVTRWFIAPMLNDSGDGKQVPIGVIILVEDITEQKNLERSKDEFLSIASHELRTPLTVIRGNSAMINKYYAASITDKDVTGMVEDIHDSSIRLIGIVNDFLDVSALEQGKIKITPEDFALIDVVNDVGRELEQLCESKGIRFVVEQSVAALPPIRADKQRIKQVIYNLVGNATKFTENGSISISGHFDDKFCTVYVTDTGRGMSQESQKLLFRKFQQASSSLLTRDTTKGTGLGLYISKLIVELSGGSIALERSEVDQGSTFAFSLPRSEKPAVAERIAQ